MKIGQRTHRSWRQNDDVFCISTKKTLSFSREWGFREILLLIQFWKEIENAQTAKIVPQTVSNTDWEWWYWVCSSRPQQWAPMCGCLQSDTFVSGHKAASHLDLSCRIRDSLKLCLVSALIKRVWATQALRNQLFDSLFHCGQVLAAQN